MLGTLARDIEEHGGQPISVEPQPPAGAPVAGFPAVADAGATAAGTETDTDTAAGKVPAVMAAGAGPWGSAPSVTVAPLPAPAPPAVHVTAIPVEAPAASATEKSAGNNGPTMDSGQAKAEDKKELDDTSTAAISIVDVTKN
jgi:macrolide phosphotransferase